jgi:hypothetical protein
MSPQPSSFAGVSQDLEPVSLDPRPVKSLPEFTFRDRRSVLFAFLLTLAVGFLYIVLVPPGTPYDEPSHFGTVQYYASMKRMPVLGQPGVSYEAQMGPVFYTVAAAVYSISHGGGAKASFYLLRFLDLLLMYPLQYLTYRIVQCTVPGRRLLPLAATVFTGLSPALLGIAASIQNDMLAMVFAYWAVLFVWRSVRAGLPSPAAAAPAALIVSLAILTKLTAAFLIPALVLYLLIRYRLQALAYIAAFVATISACTGWWFARNLVLYGDLTGSAGLRRFGYKNLGGPLRLEDVLHGQTYIRDISGSFWLPNGYYRNLFHLSLPELALLLALFAVLGLLCGSSAFFPRQSGLLPRAAINTNAQIFFACLGGSSVLLYALMSFGVGNVAVRTTFPVYFLFALAMNAGGLEFARKYGRNERGWVVGMAAVMVFLSVLTVRHVHAVPLMGFNHLFG